MTRRILLGTSLLVLVVAIGTMDAITTKETQPIECQLVSIHPSETKLKGYARCPKDPAAPALYHEIVKLEPLPSWAYVGENLSCSQEVSRWLGVPRSTKVYPWTCGLN